MNKKILLVIITLLLCFYVSADTLLVTGFEDPGVTISSYKGQDSKIEIDYNEKIVHDGNYSVMVKNNTKDYTGALINLSEDVNDWAGYDSFNMWIYGSKSKKTFKVIIEDDGFEQFSFEIADDFKGWQQIKIPIKSFKSRTDWQADNAKVDKKITYPLKTLHFCAANPGKFTLYFDFFELEGKGKKKSKKNNTNKNIKKVMIKKNLRTLASKHGLFIGAAIEPDHLKIKDFAGRLSENYNMLTAENRMKWQFIHPKKDKYAFTEADQLVDFAVKNKMKVRGHALLWHMQNPSWLTDKKYSKTEMLNILKDHIYTVAGHYKGKIDSWDVVNEVFEPGRYRKTVWLDAVGPEYIEKAFIWANEADPDAKLILNDYAVADINAKSDFMYKIVKELLKKKIPIDGVGFQLHLDLTSLPDFTSIAANVKRFTDLGLEVQFTEIDVRIPGKITESKLKKQAKVYGELFKIALFFKDKCSRIAIWGLTDKFSWIPSFYNGYDAALLFDENYNPKLAFYEVQKTLETGPVEIDTNYDSSKKGRRYLPVLSAVQTLKEPKINGRIEKKEWDNAVIYPFAYNQLNAVDQRPPSDKKDISGSWRIMYKGNKIYGLIERIDDKTVTNNENVWENDTVEIFFEVQGIFIQLRTLVGKDFEEINYDGKRKAVWSKDGKTMEFIIELPLNNLTDNIIGWNIALADNDKGPSAGRDHQLYPYYGFNDSWQGKNLLELKFLESEE